MSHRQSNADPLRTLSRTDPCWCGSGQAYRDCHDASHPLSGAGDPLPADPDGALYISPNTLISDITLAQLARSYRGSPIYAPSRRDVLRPLRTTAGAYRLGKAAAARATHDVPTLASQRFEILKGHGLMPRRDIGRHLRQLTETDLNQLRYAAVDIARLTIDRLLWEAKQDLPPTTVWAPGAEPARAVASTMFWADHYLMEDEFLSAVMAEPIDPTAVAAAVRNLHRHRGLLEAGLLVPLAMDVAEVMGSTVGDAWTERDLQDARLMAWLRSQITLVEGPSARQAILFQVRDDWNDEAIYYLYAEIMKETAEQQPNGAMQVVSRLLGPYRSNFDYGPWIRESRRRAAVTVLRRVNIQMAIAEIFGSHLLATSPFLGRLLHRKGSNSGSPGQALAWAGVPALIRGDAAALARILQHHDSVEALRLSVRRAFLTASRMTPDDAAKLARELVDDIQREGQMLQRKMESDRKTIRAVFHLGLASLAIGAIGGVAGVLAGSVGGLAALTALRPLRQEQRRHPAFAVLLEGSASVRQPRSNRGQFMAAGGFTDTVLTR